MHKILLPLLLTFCFVSPSYAAKVCLKADGKIVTKRKCKGKNQLLNLDLLSIRLDSDTCSSCGTDLSGDWTYTEIDTNNLPVSVRNITLNQTGKSFNGSNLTHTVVGIVEGSWIRLTQTVSGEEGEGYVRIAEGSLYQVGTILLGTLVIINDTFGNEGGALIFRKNLAP